VDSLLRKMAAPPGPLNPPCGVSVDPPPGQPSLRLSTRRARDELARSGKEARAAATAGFTRLVDTLAGDACNAVVRSELFVAAATIDRRGKNVALGADPELSAEILLPAEKNLAAISLDGSSRPPSDPSSVQSTAALADVNAASGAQSPSRLPPSSANLRRR